MAGGHPGLTAFALAFHNIVQTVDRTERDAALRLGLVCLGSPDLHLVYLLFGECRVASVDRGDHRDGRRDPRLVLRPRDRGPFPDPAGGRASYYVIPIVSRAPLFSHALSLVGFWSILMFYPHIGTHHLLQTPAPTWLKIVAVTGSIGMLIPVTTVLVNLWLTMKGRMATIHADIGGKFVFAGLVWYLFVCFQGLFQSLPSVQRVTHLTNWVVAHSHIAVFGFSGFIALGGALFRPTPDHTAAPLQRQACRHSVLAAPYRAYRLFSRPHLRGSHPGDRLAVRRDRL